jgi:hypothetical protein
MDEALNQLLYNHFKKFPMLYALPFEHDLFLYTMLPNLLPTPYKFYPICFGFHSHLEKYIIK